MPASNQYPFFDILEIIPDNDLLYKQLQPLKPVKTGDTAPEFTVKADYLRWRRFYNGTEKHGPVSLGWLLNKPLVISFYSKHWKKTGVEQLVWLNGIQREVRENGGNLLVISAENDDELTAIASENNLSLNFYCDHGHEIAEKFRVYSDGCPIWNRYSGVDVNAPLPATYAISLSRKIIYDHVDPDLISVFSVYDILSVIGDAALIGNNKRSA